MKMQLLSPMDLKGVLAQKVRLIKLNDYVKQGFDFSNPC